VARTRRRDRQAELLRRAEEAFAQGRVHVAAFLIEGLRGLEPVADADLGARVADLATLVEKRKHRLATQDRPAKAERR
jgi:hypothetical protein